MPRQSLSGAEAGVPLLRRMGRVRAALIDLDGTLLDTAPDLAIAANAMLAELGREPLPPQAVRDLVGKGIAHLVRRSLELSAAGAPPDDAGFDAALAIFARHYERCNGTASRIYSGVHEGLRAMRERGLRLACVTNKASNFTAPLLASTGLAAYFDAVVTSDVVGKRKPDPGIFLHACKALDVSPDETVVIGDSGNDSEGARAAGCVFLLVPYGYREGRDVQDIECDGIVPTLLHAAKALGQANKARK